MKTKYLLVLALAVLLVTACGSQMATPTSRVDVSTAEDVSSAEEAETVVPDDTATPVAEQPLTTTMPVTATGGVEVALAAVEPVEGVLATVNGQEITWADYEPELNQALHSVTLAYGVDWNQAENIDLLPTFQDQILQTVIDRIVLRQSAAGEGFEASQEDVEARIEKEKAAIVDSGQFSSWEQFLELYGLSEEYYARLMQDEVLIDLVSEAHAPDREVEQVHARHILVAAEETGNQVLARLEAGEEWAALASELSQDTGTKDSEGDLGWFPRGVMVPAFEEAAFSLEPGATSDLVQSDYGYHIIQVLEKGMREADDDTYEVMVSDAFSTWFNEQKEVVETTITVTFAPAE